MPRRPAQAASHTATPEPAEPLSGEDSGNDLDQPAVLISPVKARAAKRGIANKSDIEVWGLPDSVIIGEYLFFGQYGAHSCVFRGFKGYLALKCV
jgi:hypothetical protein